MKFTLPEPTDANSVKTPWFDSAGDIPVHLDYFDGSMFDAVKLAADTYPDNIAYDFMGRSTTYKSFMGDVIRCAKALAAIGVQKNDSVTIMLPNCPQAIVMLYAVNFIGAVANMVHPLSSEKDIEFYLNESKSFLLITLDQFYSKVAAVCENSYLKNVILTSVKDALTPIMKLGYMLTQGRKIPSVLNKDGILFWKGFLDLSKSIRSDCKADTTSDTPAVILYSGGTTGITKGILLSNLNFNALKEQIVATNPVFSPGDKMLAAMPLFHGFGLGVCIHSMLSNGGRCVLVPRFTPKSYARLITKYKCNFIAGVPTLYEALLRLPDMDNADLSSLKGVFSGGDSLSVELKHRFDEFLRSHNSSVRIREGYGTTECVTASCLTPMHISKEGSIGIPFPDTYYKIVEPGTENELSYGKEGEILLSGPTVMKEYINNPQETASTLRRHADGLTWVYTGDLGFMDGDGFIYFRGRIKRMIVSSGYNIYPAQLENILDAHEYIAISCVIGVKDAYKMQKVKAFVTLKNGVPKTDETKRDLLEYCKKNIAKYAMPYDIEFRDELPKTLVGKVAYRILEEEEASKTE